MVDLKLTEKVSAICVIILGLLVAVPFGLSYLRDEPFVVYGKEFGFGASELRNKTAELKNCKSESTIALAEAHRRLAEASEENKQLREANSVLTAQEQDRKKKESALWFPIDDIEFVDGGSFVTEEGRQGRGKWSHPDSELTLKLLVIGAGELVVETNLPPPANKLRMQRDLPVLVPMKKWDYRLWASSIYSEKAQLRIERRPKS